MPNNVYDHWVQSLSTWITKAIVAGIDLNCGYNLGVLIMKLYDCNIIIGGLSWAHMAYWFSILANNALSFIVNLKDAYIQYLKLTLINVFKSHVGITCTWCISRGL